MQHLSTKFSPTLVTASGQFAGYGAVFGNVDSHRDVIEPGAFAASLAAWRARGKLPAMRLQHGDNGSNPFRHDNLPVGIWTAMREDTAGLWVEGRLLALDTDLGKRLHALLTAGVLDGLSIGFRPVKSRVGSGRVSRYLTEIDLREISIVDEPSNDLARIAAISPTDAALNKLRDAVAALGAKETRSADSSLEKLRAAFTRLEVGA